MTEAKEFGVVGLSKFKRNTDLIGKIARLVPPIRAILPRMISGPRFISALSVF
jgi:hypothetical protein